MPPRLLLFGTAELKRREEAAAEEMRQWAARKERAEREAVERWEASKEASLGLQEIEAEVKAGRKAATQAASAPRSVREAAETSA